MHQQKKQETEKESEFNSLQEQTPDKLWLNDLTVLEEVYDKWIIETTKSKQKNINIKKTKK